MPKITVGTGSDGTPTEIADTDQGAGAPVVLVHGWPLSGRAWESQVLPLVEAGHHVITYDRRGFGDSSQPWDGYDTFAADLDRLMTALDLRGATLVGFSMRGGEVVRCLSTFGQDRVVKAVLAAAVPPHLLTRRGADPLQERRQPGRRSGRRHDRPTSGRTSPR